MDLQSIKIIPLPSKDCIRKFRCGESEIDGWAKSKAHKHHNQNRVRVFCAVENDSNIACGFYALSFAAKNPEILEDNYKNIYRGQGVPLIYITYVAVLRSCQSEGLGRLMLIDALKKAHSVARHVAYYGVALRSLNERTTKFYEKMGFGIREEGRHPLMILPVWTLFDLFGNID